MIKEKVCLRLEANVDRDRRAASRSLDTLSLNLNSAQLETRYGFVLQGSTSSKVFRESPPRAALSKFREGRLYTSSGVTRRRTCVNYASPIAISKLRHGSAGVHCHLATRYTFTTDSHLHGSRLSDVPSLLRCNLQFATADAVEIAVTGERFIVSSEADKIKPLLLLSIESDSNASLDHSCFED